MNEKAALKSLAALAQETRLAIFRLLVQQGPEGLAVGTIADQLHLANATLSFHLKELANAELISAVQDGRFIYYSAKYHVMNDLLAYLTENCCQGDSCLPKISVVTVVAKRSSRLQKAANAKARR